MNYDPGRFSISPAERAAPGQRRLALLRARTASLNSLSMLHRQQIEAYVACPSCDAAALALLADSLRDVAQAARGRQDLRVADELTLLAGAVRALEPR